MCLYLEKGNARKKIATEDIVCYKVMEEVSLNGGIPYYRTPYQGNIMPIEGLVRDEYFDNNPWAAKRYNKKMTTQRIYANNTDHICESFVSGGMIHTFADLLDASEKACSLAILNNMPNACLRSNSQYNYGRTYVVVKCIIPKGTEYFEGFTGMTYNGFIHFGAPSYCSSKLQFTGEIVDKNGKYWEKEKDNTYAPDYASVC
jgi:hypothetical protein